MGQVIELPNIKRYTMRERVAANVRALCAYRGLSQSDLARALGVGFSTNNLKWRGVRAWSFEDLEEISKILEVPEDAVLGVSAPPTGLEPVTLWSPTEETEGLGEILFLPGAEERETRLAL